MLFTALSLLAACKKDKDDSPVTPLTLYSVRGTEDSPGKYTAELVGIDPETANVSTILNLSTLPDDFTISYIQYLAATNEVVGLDRYSMRLMKINVLTKQTTAINLSGTDYQEYEGLELDKDGNLYTVGVRVQMSGARIYTLTKIDPATAKTTAIATFVNKGLFGLTYIPATNELVGVSGEILSKYNLTTKDTSSVKIAYTTYPGYQNLVVDDKSNLYAFKGFGGRENYSQIVKLDPVTGAETVITTLSDPEPIYTLLFVPKRNEIISVWEDTSLYRYNMSTNKSTLLPLTSASNVEFGGLTSN